MSFEVIDALFNPGCYDTVYPYSYLFTWFVTIPHSLLTQLAFPDDNTKYGEPLATSGITHLLFNLQTNLIAAESCDGVCNS